jgi:hypothetical protein
MSFVLDAFGARRAVVVEKRESIAHETRGAARHAAISLLMTRARFAALFSSENAN